MRASGIYRRATLKGEIKMVQRLKGINRADLPTEVGVEEYERYLEGCGYRPY
jgi:hypothetical protein